MQRKESLNYHRVCCFIMVRNEASLCANFHVLFYYCQDDALNLRLIIFEQGLVPVNDFIKSRRINVLKFNYDQSQFTNFICHYDVIRI